MASPADPPADAATFRRRFRGFDPDAVRVALAGLTERVRVLDAERAALADRLEAAEARPPFDEDTVTTMLGDEAARVLAAARDGAAEVLARAEEEAARVSAEAVAGREAAEEATKQRCREMLDETRQVRERMLRDLARRRDAAREQITLLLAERDRLLGVLAEARAAVEAAESTVSSIEAPADEPGPSLAPVTEPVPVVAPGPLPLAEPLAVEIATSAAPAAVEPPAAAPEPADVSVAPVAATAEPAEDIGAGSTAAPALPAEPTPSAAPAEPPAVEPAPSEPSAVDALFARIRAGGASQVVARSVAATVGPLDWGDEPAEAGAPVAAPEAPPAEPAPEEPPDRLAARAAALAPAETGLARRLKRALADEQNRVLDTLRREGVPADVDGLVGVRARHGEAFREAAEDDVEAAAFAGVRAVEPGADAAAAHAVLDAHRVLDTTLDRMVDDLVDPLRERLARCLADAGGDEVEASSLLRATYREWKTQRIDELAADLVLVAHGAAVFAALAPGTPVCWRVDPSAPPCPDADDNALAGAVAAGTPFPTGHRHPPAHPGCRCHMAEVGR